MDLASGIPGNHKGQQLPADRTLAQKKAEEQPCQVSSTFALRQSWFLVQLLHARNCYSKFPNNAAKPRYLRPATGLHEGCMELGLRHVSYIHANVDLVYIGFMSSD